MREIKFRMWTGKEMLNVDVMALSPCGWGCPDYDRNGVSLAYQPHIKVMQYTGLKDKNGTEIFEGDIVEFNNCDYQRTAGHLDDEIIVGEIEYSCGAWGIKAANGQLYDLYSALVNDEELEVIGNIYENPELLEVQND